MASGRTGSAEREEGRHLSRTGEEFLSYLAIERGRASSSITSYRHDLLAYEEFLAGRSLLLTEVGPSVIEDYLGFLRAAGLRPASRARALAAIRGLHGFCQEEGVTAGDPTEEVESPKVAPGLPKSLTEAEVERLLGAVVGDEPAALRDRAILELLYASGLRISELVGIDLADLDLDAALVRCLGKGSKERILPVGRPAVAALLAWLGPAGRPRLADDRPMRRDDAEAVFVSTRARRMSRQAAWTVVRRAAVVAGLADRVTPHVLRHSFATHLLDHGADVRVVQELLGHASIATMQIYTKVSQEHLRRAYANAHPRRRDIGGLADSLRRTRSVIMAIYDTDIHTLQGEEASLGEHKGEVLLLVNVASRCGLTPQYEGLEALERRFGPEGFHVLGFPCNQFGTQEPGTAEEIATFCSTTYGVSFPMYEKIEVNGAGRHPLYAELSAVADDAGEAGDITWNFEKFLVGRDGTVLRRFRPQTTPEDPEVVGAIEAALTATDAVK